MFSRIGSTLYFGASLHSLYERHLVRIFQITADRQTVGYSGDPYAGTVQQTRNIHRSGFSLYIGIRCQNNFQNAGIFSKPVIRKNIK